ncbi:MAG: PD-(D/E)XK nuclease family protein [Thermoplasmata archaeon]
MNVWAAALLLAVGIGVAALSARALYRRSGEARWGTLEAIDAGRPETLRSERFRLVGRPDVVRRGKDGRRVPVEVKRRPAPRGGPFRSHLVQVWTYCLLVEEVDGRSPPFGVVRYSDREFRVPWNSSARGELLAIRRAVAAPYDGRATPSPARCGRCRWAPRCDARLDAASPG